MLEHIQDDVAAIAEMVRVLKPGRHVRRHGADVAAREDQLDAVSDEYHAPKSVGGHVRIYTRDRAEGQAAQRPGSTSTGSHHAHALHSPYWWLKCAVGPRNDDHPAVAAYRRFLEWDIIEQPRSTRIAERVLSPVLGKSFVVLRARSRRHADTAHA